jgi:superfamily I DNA/RNA helicase/CRISPR/Cas system-associated exonuclease Cas4 (RecB family)
MDAWVDIRRKARACHARALLTAKGDRRGPSIIAAALKNDDLQVRRLEFSPGILGSLDRSARLVNIAKNQDPVEELVVIGHEIGHFHLHRDPHNDVTVRARGLGGDPVDSGAGKVEGYSPRERKEVQADIFAGEFLCPSEWLREEYVVRGRRPNEVATDLGLPADLVLNQMIRALLLPPLRPAPPDSPETDHALDDSQMAAVVWDKGPLLVDAGPGTGKTRTLIRRIQHLFDKGSRSSSVLALTFSNKAAEEMRERLSAMNADAAIEMWVGTFHAFGLELLTKWPSGIGRTNKVRVLDQTGSLALLEKNLEKLPLHYYQNLYEPAYELVPILRVISRCKDELVTPDQYRKAAEAAFAAATTDEEREDADRVKEIAEIYRIYDKALEEDDAVDFGDLIRLALELVQQNPDVQKYIAGFKHVLVDEFQDMNAASGALLRAICAVETDVWVVADQRQSIYRFRGAEPSNVSKFAKAFGGSRHALAHNYRSFAPVVRVFEKFSAAMGQGAMAGAWKANRATGGEVRLTVAPTLAAESEAIRDRIEELRRKGVPYRDQVILARSHLTLARITGILEELGVPLLYLGDLFERKEIRDLLSLVALGAETGGIGLVRVASLPEYQVPRKDSLEILRWARENRVSVFDALNRVSEVGGLSDRGRAGLAKLGTQLQGLSKGSPWTLLTTWLFERSEYLRPMLNGNDAVSQQQRVAIYQLLKVCGEYIAMGGSDRRVFLARIRRIELLSEDTAYRAVASEATDMDAVRVLTIHGSKGLEFPVVHLPALATGYMPSSWRGVRIPPPPSLPHLAMQPADHDAEEECLFFVGLSRARDYLSITRAEKYTTRKAGASKFLALISGAVPTRQYQGSGKSYSTNIPLKPPAIRDCYQERELDLYMKCPARYRYEVIEGLHGGGDESAYVRFHRCVYITVGWLEAERQKGKAVDTQAALAQLAVVWGTDGPIDHAFENYYRAAAESMVSGMVDTVSTETARYDRQEWAVPLGARKVAVTPDRVLICSDGTVRVHRIRTGRKTKSEPDKAIYALLRLGAALKYPGRPVSVEIFYLSTGEIIPVPAKNDEKLLAEYSDAIAEIESGDFHADPEARKCPNCPCYFICGS